MIAAPRHKRFFLLFLGLLLPVVALAVLRIGSVPLDWHEFFTALSARDGPSPHRIIVLEIRLPRVLSAVVIGASLALAGAVMQGLFRNPLADPALLGISAGGALVSAAAILFGWASLLHPSLRSFALPLAAFGGGLLAVFVIYRMAHRPALIDTSVLLLAGVAINALAAAGIGFLTVVASDAELRGFLFWMLGSFSNANWHHVLPTTVLALPSLAALLTLARALNALALSDADAGYLGFHVRRVKRIAIVCVALCVSASVSVAGIVGFVGLLAPHLLRLVIGPDHRYLLPASALAGALLLLLADSVARVAFQPLELPIGVLTAALGIPLFALLIMGNRHRSLR